MSDHLFEASILIMILMGILFGGGLIYHGTTGDFSTKEVDCYDRYGNKMIGQTCLDEHEVGEGPIYIIIGSLTMIVFSVMGVWFITSEGLA